MTLDKSLSLYILTRFLNCGLKRSGQVIPKVLFGPRPSVLMVRPPQTFRSWPSQWCLDIPQTMLYGPLFTSSCGGIHSRINKGAPFFPRLGGPGIRLSTLHTASHFIIKNFLESIIPASFFMKKSRLWKVNGTAFNSFDSGIPKLQRQDGGGGGSFREIWGWCNKELPY